MRDVNWLSYGDRAETTVVPHSSWIESGKGRVWRLVGPTSDYSQLIVGNILVLRSRWGGCNKSRVIGKRGSGADAS